MPKSFLPAKDADLLAWSLNYSTKISASPTSYGLVAGQATAYAALHSAYSTAYTTANTPATRTKSSIAAKNTARTALRANARVLARVVEATITVTDSQKVDLGLTVRAGRTPINPPVVAPKMSFVSVVGSTVKILLQDALNPGRRGRPAGVQGASIFSYVGATHPAQIADWKFEGSTNRTSFDIEFDPALAPGTKIWTLAFWFNPRSQSGPACAPIATNLQGGVSLLAA